MPCALFEYIRENAITIDCRTRWIRPTQIVTCGRMYVLSIKQLASWYQRILLPKYSANFSTLFFFFFFSVLSWTAQFTGLITCTAYYFFIYFSIHEFFFSVFVVVVVEKFDIGYSSKTSFSIYYQCLVVCEVKHARCRPISLAALNTFFYSHMSNINMMKPFQMMPRYGQCFIAFMRDLLVCI